MKHRSNALAEPEPTQGNDSRKAAEPQRRLEFMPLGGSAAWRGFALPLTSVMILECKRRARERGDPIARPVDTFAH